MNRIHLMNGTSSDRVTPHLLDTRNPLGIVKTNSIWDRQRNQLVIIVETSHMIGREIKAMLSGQKLILEAPLVSPYDKPWRTHLVGQENGDDFEEELMEIGFSEVKLKPGYQYSLLSSQVMDPNLIKVILGFRTGSRNNNN